jgi:TolA-binding protein
MSRGYHNLTARYNAYFNGKESMKAGIKKINSSNKDDFDRILPVVTYSKPENVSAAFPDMDNSIKKASKVIRLHSITAKPKRKSSKMSKKKKEFYQKPEFCKWVDNSYLLMGKAHFFRQDFFQAAQNFEYIIGRFDKEEIIYDAMLWMTRVYIEEKKYDKAKEMFDRLEGDRDFPKRLKGELDLVYSDFYVKQEKYEDAIPKLLKSIEKAKSKPDKARLKFILAQIYQRLKEYNKASILYASVIK